MKKIIIFICLSLFLVLKVFATESYILTADDNILIDKITKKIFLSINENWETEKTKYISIFEEKLKNLEENSKNYTISEKIKEILINYKVDEKKVEIEEIKENNWTEAIKDETIKTEDTKEESTKNLEKDYKYWIDMEKVKESWLWFYNDYREKLWLNSYSYDDKLIKTAQDWSDISLERGEITHKRNKKDSYYDYKKIWNWLEERWVVCEAVNSYSYTENIWYWNYSCKKDEDCSKNLIKSSKKIFDMYLKEKNKSYKPHYQSIINESFTKIWLWISIEKLKWNNYKYYLTVHFCTKLEE